MEGVQLQQDEHGTALLMDAAGAGALDALLQRLGDLGVSVVSIDQQAPSA